ncbi:hypothetical protein [Nocardioides sp. URHA0032]|uniref:hypothetical protein n=1 Tax=Nocardioides sp. URHA0032 TaxID=1380388 RepID=UPI00048F8D3F|nr:hypothetical protein [Nocardioides sp. URHA0032]
MNENPRRRLLRRARLTTAGIAVTAVAGTGALTAVASNATATGDGTGGGSTGGNGGQRQAPDQQGRARSSQGGTGVVQAPASSQPQAATNAS